MKLTKNKIAYAIIFLLILFGIFLRFYNLRNNTQFDFDQEDLIAFPAKNILVEHNLPIVGGKASVGDLYIGPLYSYLAAAAFLVTRMDPIGGAYLSAIISTLTIIIGFVLIKKLFNFKTAVYYSLVWSTSTMIVNFDRTPWNVNLLPLSSLLIFLGLLYLTIKKNNFGWWLSGLGIFLAFNSHPSCIFLLLGMILFALVNREIINKFCLITVVFIVLAISPLILFNLKHGFLLTKNFTLLFQRSSGQTDLIEKIINIGVVQISTLGRLFFADAPIWIVFSMGLIFILTVFSLKKNAIIKKYLRLFILFNISYFIFFINYSGQITDYYFLGLLPLSTLGLSLVLYNLERKFAPFSFLVAVFFLMVSRESYLLVSKLHPNGLWAKQQIAKTIKENSGDNKIAVIYDMDRGLSFGYDYLYYYNKVPIVAREETKNIFWISFPSTRFPTKPDYVFGEIALGLPETYDYIVKSKDARLYNNLLKLRIPNTWSEVACPSIDLEKYLLSDNLNSSCSSFKEERGIALYNLPNCTVPSADDDLQLHMNKTTEELVLKSIKTPDFGFKRPLLSYQLESNRCILLFEQPTINPEITKKIVESIKLN